MSFFFRCHLCIPLISITYAFHRYPSGGGGFGYIVAISLGAGAHPPFRYLHSLYPIGPSCFPLPPFHGRFAWQRLFPLYCSAVGAILDSSYQRCKPFTISAAIALYDVLRASISSPRDPHCFYYRFHWFPASRDYAILVFDILSPRSF